MVIQSILTFYQHTADLDFSSLTVRGRSNQRERYKCRGQKVGHVPPFPSEDYSLKFKGSREPQEASQ